MREVPKLARRPEARAYSVESLLQLAQDGKLRVPEFQRPQRWRSTHVLSLFDSVWRGFPVGEFLFSKGKASAATLHFGPVKLVGPEVADAYFIVDGQQRICALVGALLHPSPRPRGDIHALWYDLEAERFERLAHGEAPLHWIPLNVVGDSFKQLGWLNTWSLQKERSDLVQRALLLGKAIREYQAPAYIVDGASEEALRLIFKRVNTAGVGMREEEVFQALNGLKGRALTVACARLGEMGFGPVREADFVDTVKAVEGMDPRRRFRESERELEVDAGAVERTETALRHTLAFLVGHAGIPHVQLLPYRLPLRLLARFFHLHPDPGPRTLGLLVRWVWRGALSGAHADDGDVRVSELQALIGPDPHSTVAALLRTVPRHFEYPSLMEPWNGRGAKTRLCALALFHRGPRDPDTGAVLGAEAFQQLLTERKELGRVFQTLKRRQGTRPTIAQRFLVRDAGQLSRLFGLRLLLSPSDAVWDSHGLDSAAVRALQTGNEAEFERLRAERLDPWMRGFFRERSAPEDSDRPAIAGIVARVDSHLAKVNP